MTAEQRYMRSFEDIQALTGSPDVTDDLVLACQEIMSSRPELDAQLLTYSDLYKILAKERYNELVDTAVKANVAYHGKDDPIMEDPEYDEVKKEIKRLEAFFQDADPSVLRSDSPTKTVGAAATGATGKFKHVVRMLSLEDVFSYEEVDAFVDRLAADTEMSVEPKCDGISVSLDFVDGIFVQGLLRGDGVTADDITANLQHVGGVPAALKPTKESTNLRRLVVRGEVVLPVKAFLKINETHEKTGGRIFANPRNAAAGILRSKNPDVAELSELRVIVFNVQYFERKNVAEGGDVEPMFSEHMASLLMLNEFGFDTVSFFPATTKAEIRGVIRHIGEVRPHLPYWIDGAVVKVNNLHYRKVLGETSNAPRWAVAFKYPPEEKTSTVKEIILQTGRTGRITPVAVFDPPISLGGTTVERATLHNQKKISDICVNVGDTVVVRKAAEIIPEVVRVEARVTNLDETSGKPHEFRITDHVCPSCGGPIKTNAEGTEEFCENPQCPAQKARLFEHFCSRECMDIQGLGPNLINALIANGLLKELPDIYHLEDHIYEMTKMEGLGIKQVEKLLKAIDKSKDQDLERLIKALGIPGVGRHIGRELSKRYPNLLEITSHPLGEGGVQKKEAELAAIEGVGPVSAKAIMDYFSSRKNWETVFGLSKCGVNMKSRIYNKAAVAGSLSGKTFVITGTLSRKREEIAADIEAHGGKVASSVSKKTDFLVAGDNAGSKLEKANALGVKVISESELLGMF